MQSLHLPETHSTNSVALDWDAPDGSYVWADAQTGGRGRLGREWSSPPNRGVYLSILNPFGPQNPLTPIWGALAVCQAIEELTPLQIKCKWPNDILCRGLKIGGLLCENRPQKMVLGIGLNLNHREEELPPRPVFPASSLFLLTEKTFEVAPFIEKIIEKIRAQHFSLEDYSARLYGIGEIVKIGDEIGVLRGVDENGALKIQTATGEKSVLAGDLQFL